MNTSFSKQISQQIESKIFEIERTLDEEWRSCDSISLMTGLSGVPLFYAQMDKWTNSRERIPKVYDVLEKIFDYINDGQFIMTYSSGIIGVGYMLNLLKNEQVTVKGDLDDHLDFLDDLIIEKSLEQITRFEHIDFLHGRLGAANYFLERGIKDVRFKKRIKQLFYNIADVVDNEILETKRVKDLDEFDDLTHRTNCGLAHGHTSVILIFSKYLKSFPNDKRILHSLNSSVECLLGFKSVDFNSMALFPGIAVNQKTQPKSDPAQVSVPTDFNPTLTL